MLLNLGKKGEQINLYLEITCLPACATHTNQLISQRTCFSVSWSFFWMGLCPCLSDDLIEQFGGSQSCPISFTGPIKYEGSAYFTTLIHTNVWSLESLASCESHPLLVCWGNTGHISTVELSEIYTKSTNKTRNILVYIIFQYISDLVLSRQPWQTTVFY